ncbi:MAG: hypothetical protein OES38_01500 [Gammaproteobacteria bacterium]|nr:hypothetical protein [Gammaproteobacteria bacterium]
MNESKTSVHWSFWTISTVALIWNVMSVINYLTQMNPDALATYSESARALVEGRPAWATGAFAIAAFGGVLGCLLLLFRKSSAYYVLIASLIGVVVTMLHTFIVSRSTTFSPFEIALMMLMPLIVAAFLVWYAKLARNTGWIR